MKILQFLITAMFCVASVSLAEPMPLPNPNVSKHLSIGGAAVVETLAQADTLEVYCTAPSATTKFFRKVKLASITSPDDMIPVIQGIRPSFGITDAKDFITLTGIIRGVGGVELFRSERQFQMEKVGYAVDGSPVYRVPNWAGDMYFIIQDLLYSVGDDITEGYMLAMNGDKYQLNIIDGRVQIFGWMNYVGRFSELVLNGGQYRFDMITGDRMDIVIATPVTNSVMVHGIEYAEHVGNSVTIATSPQYGAPPNFEVRISSWKEQSFHLQVKNSDNWGGDPITIKVAMLKDLVPGGIGWTKFPYQSGGMWINVPNPGVYYIYPEYKSQDIGREIYYPQPATRSTGGGGGSTTSQG